MVSDKKLAKNIRRKDSCKFVYLLAKQHRTSFNLTSFLSKMRLYSDFESGLPWKTSEWKMGKKVKMQGSERSRDDVDSVEFWFGWLMASSLFLSSKSRGLRAESQTTRTKTRTMIILTHKKCPGKWANGDGGVRRPLMRHIFMYLEVILSHPVRQLFLWPFLHTNTSFKE